MASEGSRTFDGAGFAGYPPDGELESPPESFPKDDGEHPVPSPFQVTEALKHILASEFFRASPRGKQFLTYVVQYQLEHHPEPLKERIIGAALFNRPMDYATGDDSVVRAQAREVRRRLDKYYMAHPHRSPVRIELPVGSYSAEFKWDESQIGDGGFAPASLTVLPGIIPAPALSGPPDRLRQHPERRRLYIGAWVALILCGALVFTPSLKRTKTPRSAIAQFWAPAFASSKPILICLPQPILYRPSADLYKRSAKFPGEFDREVYRMNHPPHLQPEDTLHWADMSEFYEYGVSKGDVQAAVRLSNFIGHLGKDSEVRIGSGYSYEDLRNSSAVVIGAYSNPWTIEMLSGLHFTFADDEKGLRIQEQTPSGRSWFPVHGTPNSPGTDYGLVTRLRDSATGQFDIFAAGVEASGSDAAADLIVNPDAMEKALQKAPRDWAQKNVQIVVSTEVKDSAAGPARVIAIYTW